MPNCFIHGTNGSRGNFEVMIAPANKQGFIHLWKNNDTRSRAWTRNETYNFGNADTDVWGPASLLQADWGNLEWVAINRASGQVSHFWKGGIIEGGPHLVSPKTFVGVPSLFQNNENFKELFSIAACNADTPGGFQELVRTSRHWEGVPRRDGHHPPSDGRVRNEIHDIEGWPLGSAAAAIPPATMPDNFNTMPMRSVDRDKDHLFIWGADGRVHAITSNYTNRIIKQTILGNGFTKATAAPAVFVTKAAAGNTYDVAFPVVPFNTIRIVSLDSALNIIAERSVLTTTSSIQAVGLIRNRLAGNRLEFIVHNNSYFAHHIDDGTTFSLADRQPL